jgi:hypothetical protein
MTEARARARSREAWLIAPWVLSSCVLACACGEDAPRDRDQGPPPTPRQDGGVQRADASVPYDGTCSGKTCPNIAFGAPCCTRPGTGIEGHELENVGRAAGLCGADLSVIVPSLGGICLEVDRPGALDPSCPAQISIAGGDPRPGCCTDEGFCGSRDPVVPLGCFYATGLKGHRCGPRIGDEDDAGSR